MFEFYKNAPGNVYAISYYTFSPGENSNPLSLPDSSCATAASLTVFLSLTMFDVA